MLAHVTVYPCIMRFHNIIAHSHPAISDVLPLLLHALSSAVDTTWTKRGVAIGNGQFLVASAFLSLFSSLPTPSNPPVGEKMIQKYKTNFRACAPCQPPQPSTVSSAMPTFRLFHLRISSSCHVRVSCAVWSIIQALGADCDEFACLSKGLIIWSGPSCSSPA
jgi:hypothetical protein